MYLLDEKLKKKTRIEKKAHVLSFLCKVQLQFAWLQVLWGENFLEEMIEAKLHCCRPAQKLVCCMYTA